MFFILISCQQNELDNERIIRIGEKLTQTDAQQIPDIIVIGNGLREKMTELQNNSSEFRFEIQKGDFKMPYGDNKADVILTIKTDYKNIGIRLKYNREKDKYHILGWREI